MALKNKEKLTNSLINTLTTTGKNYRVWDTEQSGFYLFVTKAGTKTYYIRYTLPGELKSSDFKIGRHGQLSPAEARKRAAAYIGEVAKGIDIQAERVAKKKAEIQEKASTLGAFMETLYPSSVIAHKDQGKKNIAVIKRLFGHWYSLQLADITPRRIHLWQAEQIKKGRSYSGINRDVTRIQGVLSKAVEFEIIPFSPLRGFKKLKIDKKARVRFLDKQEELRLRAALEEHENRLRTARDSFNQWRKERSYEPLPSLGYFADHIKPIVLLALSTGMRRGELFNLKWTHINWDQRLLTIEGEGGSQDESSGSKNSQTRHVPLTLEAYDILRSWRKQNMDTVLVFTSPKTGGRLDNIDSAWKSVRKQADLFHPDNKDLNFRFHDLRHSFASNLVMAGVDLNQVREFLGHETIEMTLKYAHLAQDVKFNAINTLSKFMEKRLTKNCPDKTDSSLAK